MNSEYICIEKSLLTETGNLEEALILTYFKNSNSNESKTLESIKSELSLQISKATLSRKIKKLEKQGFLSIYKEPITNKYYYNYSVNKEKSQDDISILNNKKSTNNISDEEYELNVMKEEIKLSIDYEYLKSTHDTKADAIVELIHEVCISQRKFFRVNSSNVHRSVVIERLKQLKANHIDKVLNKFKEQYKRIKSVKNYLLTMLFNVVQEDEFEQENLYNVEAYAEQEQKRRERLELVQLNHEARVMQMVMDGDLEGLQRVGYLDDVSRQRVLDFARENAELKRTVEIIKSNANKTINLLNTVIV